MHEFFTAALPWVLMGLCLALFFAHRSSKKAQSEPTSDYLIEGLCAGAIAGALLSSAFSVNTGIGMGFGMLVGETAGMLIPKRGGSGPDDG